MARVKWIKITTDIFDDEKIKLIDAFPEKDTILVIWFKLLTLAGKTNDNGLIYLSQNINFTDEMLATLFNRPLNSVRLALKILSDFRMIEMRDGVFAIKNWEKHQNVDGMDKIRKQNADRQKKFRENKKIERIEFFEKNSNVTDNVTVTEDENIFFEKELKKEKKQVISMENYSNVMRNVTVTESNATDIDKDIDIESYDHDHNNYNNLKNIIEQDEKEKKNEHEFFDDDLKKIKQWFDEVRIDFSKKHKAKVIELLKNNSVAFLLHNFREQYEILKNKPEVKNIAAVFSNHLFKGTCEVNSVLIIEKENKIKQDKANERKESEKIETILDKFKRLELDKQEEIIQEIIRGSPHPNLKEIRENAPNIFLNLIHRKIEEKMKGLNYGINSD